MVPTTVASGGGFHWGAVLIVLFTGLTFVIAALGYRVVRRSVGLGRAVKVSRSRSTWEPAQRLYDPWIGINFTRLAIHLSHRVTFVPEKSHLWWPRVRPVEFIPPDREMRIGEKSVPHVLRDRLERARLRLAEFDALLGNGVLRTRGREVPAATR